MVVPEVAIASARVQVIRVLVLVAMALENVACAKGLAKSAVDPASSSALFHQILSFLSHSRVLGFVGVAGGSLEPSPVAIAQTSCLWVE